MIMHFAWVSWKAPDLAPDSELNLAKAISAYGKTPLVKRFLGLSPSELPPSKEPFFETHAAGLIYLGVFLACFTFGDWDAPPPKKASFGSASQFVGILSLFGAAVFYGSMAIAVGRYTAWLASIERKYFISRRPTSSPASARPEDNGFYEMVADEISEGRVDKVAWTRAVANSAGDENLAMSLYVRYRVQALQEAHTEQARAAHEAQVQGWERQRFHEREAREAAAREQAEEDRKTFWVVVTFVILIFAIMKAAIDSHSESSSLPAAVVPQMPQLAQKTTLADRKAAADKMLSDLDTEYRVLVSRRSSLDPSDSEKVAAFNRDAADYTRRTQLARAEKALLSP